MGFDFTGMKNPGPGIAPGAPRKKGLARLWEILSRDFGSIFVAGLAATVALLPAALAVSLGMVYDNFWICLLGGALGGAVFGPFYAALCTTVLRALQDDPTPWQDRWRHGLRGNLPQTVTAGAGMGAVFGAMLLIGRLMLSATGSALPAFPVWMMLLLDFLLLTLFFGGAWPQLCLPDTKMQKGGLAKGKAALLLILHAPLRCLAAAVLQLVWYGLAVAIFPTGVIFMPFIGLWPAVLGYLFVLFPALERDFDLPQYTVTPSAAAKDADGLTRGERAEIWWRRHFGWVLAAAALISCGLGVATTFLGRTEPDFQLAIVSEDALPDAVVDALQTSLVPYVRDANGDGQVSVRVNNYTVSFTGRAESPDAQMAGATLLSADLSAGDSTIWLLQDADGFYSRYGDKVDVDAAVAWAACPVLRNLDAGHYSTALDIDTAQSGQALLQGFTLLPLADGDRSVYTALSAAP